MFTVRSITAFDSPELLPYATMRRQQEHRDHGIFVAEGEKVVRRLIESRFELVSVLLPEKWFAELAPQLEARPEHVQVFVAEKKMLETLTGFSMYQGLLAVGKVPRQASLDELIAASVSPRLLLAADSLSSAQNLGSLVRNCAAFNVDVLLVGETASSPYLRRAVRSSMGTVFQQAIVESDNLAAALAQLRRHGIRTVAAHAHQGSCTLANSRLAGDCCIVVGSEGYGISAPVLAECDECVNIPMAPNVDSLNVASAAAAFLYEANRQRGRM